MAEGVKYYEDNNGAQRRPSLIFTEGMDDIHFLSTLLEELNIDPNEIGLVSVSGTSNFRQSLEAFFKTAHFTQGLTRALAVICDADDDPNVISREIYAALSSVDLAIPQPGMHESSTSGVRVGFYLLPQKDVSGDLDLLCLGTVAGTQREIQTEAFISTAEVDAAGLSMRLNGSRHKRKVQAYLAVSPGHMSRGAGMGFKEGQFDKSHPSLNPLKEFLRNCVAPFP